MVDSIRRALTRRRFQRGHFIVEEPEETLVCAVKFGMGMTACLSAMQIACMAFLHTWNSEIFSAITALTGIIVGVFAGRKT